MCNKIEQNLFDPDNDDDYDLREATQGLVHT